MAGRHGRGDPEVSRQSPAPTSEGTLALCLEVWPRDDEPRIAVRTAMPASGPMHGGAGAPAAGMHGDEERIASTRSARADESPAVAHLVELRDALVVPAGTLVQGRVRARALLLAGEIVGTVECGPGPVVVCAGGALKGQLVAGGDVHVCGRVVDYAGGVVISTPGRLVLAPGARVDGDVRCGHVECHDDVRLNGVARAFER